MAGTPRAAHAQQARETVVLPGVVGPVGERFGVDTLGPGLLTVGNQNVNTQNNAGGGITTDAANTANILFTGSSTVTGFVGTSGFTFLHIDAGVNNTTVTFNGQVFSTTFTLTGAGTVNFNGGFVSLSGSTVDFGGDGFINLAANQTLMGAITNTAGANTGTLILGADSIADGAVGAASGLREIRLNGGNALITGQANSYMYTLGTHTLNVAGALAIPVAGTINTTIFNGTTFGRIVPVGAATIGNNLLVNVNVTGVIPSGAEFKVVAATSGTDGSTVTTTDNSALYQFSAAPTLAGEVKIIATKLPAATVVNNTPGAPPNAPPIGAAVDTLPANAETQPLLDAIVRLTTPEALAAGLSQLGPGGANINAPFASDTATQRSQDRIASHLDMCIFEPERHPKEKDHEVGCDVAKRFWVTGIGSTGGQDSRDGFEGYDLKAAGVLLGFDFPLNVDALRAGVALGYARSTLDGKDFDNHTDIDSYQGTLYVGYAPGPWFANGGVTIGRDHYAGSRRVVLPGFDSTADSHYNGMQYGVFGNVGYRFYIEDGKTVITPNAGLRYTYLTTDSYTESGGSGTNLAVNSKSYDFAQSHLGVKAARDFALSESFAIRPQVHANWIHALGDRTMKNTAAFTAGGSSFEVAGVANSRETLNLGVSAELLGHNNWSLEAGYDFFVGQGFSAHVGSLSLVLRF